MKIIDHRTVIVPVLCMLTCLSACDHDITIGSTVHADGSIDRTIVLSDADSAAAFDNIFGVNAAGGWRTTVEPARKTETGKNDKTDRAITFSKHFTTVAEANKEMDRDVDTLFHIRSTLERKNRWFYTYLEYRDTYLSLDRFTGKSQEAYFTKEDYAFIDRLPAEGKTITKADSLYLDLLNEKIFEFYGSRTIFEELFNSMVSTMKEYKVASNWEDSLVRKKEAIYLKFRHDGDNGNTDLLSVVDLQIPLPGPARAAVLRKSQEVESRIKFVSEAYTGKYQHIIQMPWPVVETNADSVNNRELHWHPPAIKFLLKDYTMIARAREMNVWAVVISGAVVLLTLVSFFIRRKGLKASRIKRQPI